MNRHILPRPRCLIGAALVGLAVSWAAGAEPLLTSWRSLDGIQYRVGCHDEQSALRAAATDLSPADRVWVDLVSTGQCFVLPIPLGAMLLEWVSGPYRVQRAGSASIWLILDEAGDTEYTFVPDLGGPHRPASAA